MTSFMVRERSKLMKYKEQIQELEQEIKKIKNQTN